MLDRCTARSNELDDELRGCIAAQTFFCAAMLDDWSAVRPALRLLTNSPVAMLRALGFALKAWLAAPADGSSAAELLDRSDAEMALALASGDVDPGSVTASFRAWAHANKNLYDVDPRDALRHTQTCLSASPDPDTCNYIHIDATIIAAVCQIIIGQPETALDTIAWLSDLDLPFYDGAEAAALAHLALGDLDAARRLIERHARRASTDRLSREACDSVLLFAALARAEGDDASARRLLAGMGVGRQPATIAYSRRLAKLLGVEDPQTRFSSQIDPTHPDGVLGAKLGLRTLRAELARRGWD